MYINQYLESFKALFVEFLQLYYEYTEDKEEDVSRHTVTPLRGRLLRHRHLHNRQFVRHPAQRHGAAGKSTKVRDHQR